MPISWHCRDCKTLSVMYSVSNKHTCNSYPKCIIMLISQSKVDLVLQRKCSIIKKMFMDGKSCPGVWGRSLMTRPVSDRPWSLSWSCNFGLGLSLSLGLNFWSCFQHCYAHCITKRWTNDVSKLSTLSDWWVSKYILPTYLLTVTGHHFLMFLYQVIFW